MPSCRPDLSTYWAGPIEKLGGSLYVSMAGPGPWKKCNHGMLSLLNLHDTVHSGQGSYLTSFIKQPS